MDPITPLHQDPLHGDTSETPHQETQRTCTRTSPCRHQGCLVCCTPTNHIRNLDEALSNSDAPQDSPTSNEDTRPPPPPNHLILIFTNRFLDAIKDNDIPDIETTNQLYIKISTTNIEFLTYNCSALRSARLTAINLLNSHNARLTTLPTSPSNGSTYSHTNPPPQAHFKAPTITAPKWSGKANEFYTWLHNLLNGFKLADCADQVKLKLTLEAIPMDKQGLLNDVMEWDQFKERLIEEFGSIDVYGRDINQEFALLTRCKSVQECAEILAPKIKRLQSNLNIMQEFFDLEILQNVTLTQQLVQNIMKSLPLEVKPSFNEKYADFRDLHPENVKSPITFEFLAQFIYKMEKNYRANPSLYDLDFSPTSVGVKATRPEPHKSNSKPQYIPNVPRTKPRHPCSLCQIKGFEDDHFALNRFCGVGKLSAPDILKIITDNHLCPTCTLNHDLTYKCSTLFKDGKSKVCTKGCLHGGVPVHFRACMHNNQAPFVTVAKVTTNKSIPLLEDVQVGKVTLGVQYDTGCQLSIISKSTLSTLPPSMYSLGTSSQIRVVTYAGEGNTILTTPVRLRLPGTTLTLTAIEEDLNNGSRFSFPVPQKWRSIVGSSISQHSGQVSILLGGDNNFHFPKEIERDSQGLALYQSKLTSKHLIYGPISPNAITWSEPITLSSIKTVSIHSVNVQALQDYLNPASPLQPDPPNNLKPATKPDPPTHPIPLSNPDPPINPASPLQPDPPSNLEPATKLDLPTHPIPLSNPDPPTNTRLTTTPDLPTYPIPPFNPDPPINPASPLQPDPPNNLEPATKPDPPTHTIPHSNPDPPINPVSPTNPRPTTKPDPPTYPIPPFNPDPPITPAFLLKPDPPSVPDPSTNTVPPLKSDSPIDQLFPFLDVEKQLPQKTIRGLAGEPVAEELAPDNSTQHLSAQDEFHPDQTSSQQ